MLDYMTKQYYNKIKINQKIEIIILFIIIYYIYTWLHLVIKDF